MTAIHAATSGALTRELVEAVLTELDAWSPVAISQASGIHPFAGEAAARFAINDLRADVFDHLGVGLAVVLASYSITADGQVEA